MKKLVSTLGVLLLAGALASCTATAPKAEETPGVINAPMSAETFVGIIFAGDNLSGVTEFPTEGETVHWNAGDSNYSDSGRYSALYRTMDSKGTEICYEDAESTGSVVAVTKAGDFNTYYTVSTQSCAEDAGGVEIESALDGGGRFDLLVSTESDDPVALGYAEALQVAFDERAANEPDAPQQEPAGERPEPIPTTEPTP